MGQSKTALKFKAIFLFKATHEQTNGYLTRKRRKKWFVYYSDKVEGRAKEPTSSPTETLFLGRKEKKSQTCVVLANPSAKRFKHGV